MTSFARLPFVLAAAFVAAAAVLVPAAVAGEPVGLGTAESFAVLAGSGITNTGPTTITGDVGTFPTTARTGFGSVTLTGTDHGGDAVTQAAKDALVTAYDDAFGRTPATPSAVELGGVTLLPGVYTSATFGLTGTLTLDAQGVAGAQFVFQAASTLIAEVGSRVVLVNGADPCRVVWQVGSSATFKTGTEFAGDVLAYTSITAQAAATFRGRLLARNGAVTLDTNTITTATCTATTPAGTPTGTPSAATGSPTAAAGPPASGSPAVGTVLTTHGPVPAAASAAPQAPAAPGSAAAPRAPAGPPGLRSRPALPWLPSLPSLPVTGLRGWLLLAGLLLLGTGVAATAAGRRTPQPR